MTEHSDAYLRHQGVDPNDRAMVEDYAFVLRQRGEDVHSVAEPHQPVTPADLADSDAIVRAAEGGSIGSAVERAEVLLGIAQRKVVALQERVDNLNRGVAASMERAEEAEARVTELEDDLAKVAQVLAETRSQARYEWHAQRLWNQVAQAIGFEQPANPDNHVVREDEGE